jgi:hypothetical protein
MRDAMLPAELDHRRGAGDAQLCFERAWLVVNAGVNNAAVVAALVAAHTIFFFQQEQSQLWKTPSGLERNREANDSSTNNGHAIAGAVHSNRWYDNPYWLWDSLHNQRYRRSIRLIDAGGRADDGDRIRYGRAGSDRGAPAIAAASARRQVGQ